jgi:peptidoglycan/xylan/chitin deacetylase (PgdA/CDA1 family)
MNLGEHYMRGQLAIRTRIRSLYRRILGNTTLVLCYHRISDLPYDPDGLAVSPRHFGEHIEVIARWRRDKIDAHAPWKFRQGGIIVTFDDAYRDNLIYATPILAKHDVLGIIFAPSVLCLHGEIYWWEVLRRLESPEFRVSSETVRDLYFKLASETTRPDLARLKGLELSRALRPCLVSLLRSSGTQTQRYFVEEGLRLIRWDGVKDEGWPMSSAELRQIAEGGLIEIGGHTRTHVRLSTLSKEEQENEIVEGKAELDSMLGRPTRCFAYPYGFSGDFNEISIQTARKAGYSAAFSFEPALVTSNSDRFRMGRFRVDDYDGDELLRRIYLWFGRSLSSHPSENQSNT